MTQQYLTGPPSLADRPSRVFHDADGICWTVSERDPDPYDRRSTPSLVFASDTIIRRVRQYPSDWHSLSDEALARLSWSL